MGLKNLFKGKKTQTGLRVNSNGKTPNGTPVTGVNKNGKLVTTRKNNNSKTTHKGQIHNGFKWNRNEEPLFY